MVENNKNMQNTKGYFADNKIRVGEVYQAVLPE